MVSDGRAGRRKWTSEQKQRIVDETRAPGASVSVVARRYDINDWRRTVAPPLPARPTAV
jgi:transposase-like protein